METAIPSGILCIAIATAMAMPSFVSFRALINVARPSGKLWMAMAMAVKRPILYRLLKFSAKPGVSISSVLWASCGFSNDGTSLSIIAMMAMPAKNDATVAQYPWTGPSSSSRDSFAFGNISTNETYIITPAEKPRPAESIFVFVLFAKNARALPTPVARPANIVNPKAIKTCFSSIFSQRFLFFACEVNGLFGEDVGCEFYWCQAGF